MINIHKHRSRWLFIYFSMIIFALLITARLFQLQILNTENPGWRESQKFLRRGAIFDRNGNVLAISLKVPSIAANPSRIPEKEKWARETAPLLKMDYDTLYNRINSGRQFVWLIRKTDDEIAEKVREMDNRQIFIINEFKRYYLNNELGCHVVGLVNLDNIGIEGIELELNHFLRNPDTFSLSMNNLHEYLQVKDQYSGKNVYLTIDKIIQYITETELEKAFLENEAESATAIVMIPHTGEILAMANFPNYNPNNVQASKVADRRNRAITDTFEPGSTMKIFAAASIIAEYKVSLNERFLCEGSISLGSHTMHCSQIHGNIPLHDVIKKSCNVGIIKASQRLPDNTFFNYLRSFGFGSFTGIDLPGEVTGILRRPTDWTRWSRFSLPLGQEISVTALQMITAGASIINSGELFQPQIIRKIENPDGSLYASYPTKQIRKVVDSQTSKIIVELLEGVMEEGGTGLRARIPGYTVAGKTGTAQIADLIKGGYHQDKVYASFLGFIPAENPRVIIFISVQEPTKYQSGGMVAAPVFRNIATRIINYLEIESEASKIVRPDYTNLNKEYRYIIQNKELMPDLIGRTMRDASRILQNYEIKFNLVGSGTCYRQEPEAGEIIDLSRPVTLYFK